uniref:RRM domain-containing protein n=1 Tax=Globisporangium ultimum (strain ATCC 200006 / CBS 805.95 / DAOM BR144) TaxID=431595 RepID=K3X6L8_GLOUD
MSDDEAASQERKSKRSSRHHADASQSVRVWLGHVPSSLCVHEEALRTLFAAFGPIHSIAIHHDFVDMSTDGFVYLELSSQREAERLVAAVQSGTLSDGDDDNSSHHYGNMQARVAIARNGGAQFDVDDEIANLLLGRRQAAVANPFSQHSVGDDEDERMLQSLSQHTFGSQPKRKKTKSATTRRKKQKAQETSFLSVNDE